MTTINLKDFYAWYTHDEYVEISDEVAEELKAPLPFRKRPLSHLCCQAVRLPFRYTYRTAFRQIRYMMVESPSCKIFDF